MKKFRIEVSHASPAQLTTIGLELKIMSNGWAQHGPQILINGRELEAAWENQKQAWLALNARLLKASLN